MILKLVLASQLEVLEVTLSKQLQMKNKHTQIQKFLMGK